MNELPELYPHQQDLRDRVRAAVLKHGRVILCGNPGFGKTRIAKWILGSSANREKVKNGSGRCLFAVQRRGLVDNAVGSFAEAPALRHGVVMSGRDTAYGAKIQVASIDSLLSWFVDAETGYKTDITFDLIVADEAHSHHSKFARFFKYHDAKREELGLHPAYVIGLTATPKAKGLADVYKEIVLGPSTQWLIDNKYLSQFRYFSATQGKLEKLRMKGGEYTKDSEAEAMDGLAGDLVRDWQRLAVGRPTVGFFPRRTHAMDALELLKQAGLRVEYVDGDTPDEQRRSMFCRLNNAELDYLCNVQVIERGTDIPRIGCVQLCVAIGSVVRYRQMIGRGSRMHPAKTDCLVIDHADNVRRHGLFEDDPHWTLDTTEKDAGEVSKRPTIECPRCHAHYRGGKCSNCGYEPRPSERAAQGLTFDGRELKEIVKEAETPKTKTPHDLMVQALFRAGRSGKSWKSCCKIYGDMNAEQGTSHRIPRRVIIAGRQYETVRFGAADGGRKVADIYPITVGGGHGGRYLVPETQTVGEAW